MSKKLITILFLLTFVAAGCGMETAPSTNKSASVYGFPFNSAKIEFTLTGSVEGTRTLYIKGDKMANDIAVTEDKDGQKIKKNLKTIELEDGYYNINLDDKTATKTTNFVYNELKKIPAESRATQLVKIATGNGYPGGTMPTKEGQKQIAGQTCDLYKMSTFGTVCLWNGLTIYSEIKLEAEKIESVGTATRIEQNIDIPDSVFQLPADVKVQEPATAT